MYQYKGLKIPITICLLAILSLPLLVTNDLSYIFITGKNFAFRVLVEVLFALYLLLMLYDNKYQPRYSWILIFFTLFLLFSIISALLGVDPRFSFLGSYLRMDGIVTLAHLFIYFVVLSHVIKTQSEWSYFFYASILVAFFVALIGIIEHNPSSTFGNVQYSAVYLFFNIFFVAFLIAHSTNIYIRFILVCVAATLAFAMLSAGERGVVCATLCAGIVSFGYLILYRRTVSIKYFIMAIVSSIVLFALFLFIFPPDFSDNETGFLRYFNLDLYKEGLSIRGKLWMIALSGFTEHPLLGFGINNFTYMFNQHYDSFYCNYNLWMDKAHNNYLEWLVCGGLIGFFAFLGFLLSPVMYLFTSGKKLFNDSERAILFGLLFGYLVINLFYFDTLTSSICFINVLALIHAQVSSPLPKWNIRKNFIPFTVVPTLVITTSLLIYYLTIPSLLAARESMLATRLPDIKDQYQLMHQAWNRNGIGNQEIMERLNPLVIQLLSSNAISSEDKYYIARQSEEELNQFIANKPRDPRAYYGLISLLMMTNNYEHINETLTAVKLLTPQKEYTMMIEGIVNLALGHLEESRDLFKQSICLETSKKLYDQVNQTMEQNSKQ